MKKNKEQQIAAGRGVFELEAHSLQDSLVKEGLPVLVVEDYCGGCVEGIYQSLYVLWEKEGREYIRKFSNYGSYKSVELSKSVFCLVDTFSVHSGEFIEEPLLHFNYTNIKYQKDKAGKLNLKISDGYLFTYPKREESLFLSSIRSHLYELEQDPFSGW